MVFIKLVILHCSLLSLCFIPFFVFCLTFCHYYSDNVHIKVVNNVLGVFKKKFIESDDYVLDS